MKHSMIIIASEILNGKITDANGPWLSKLFKEKMMSLKEISIVEDNLDDLIAQIRRHFETYDSIYITGGLGPTPDDITMKALSIAFDSSIEENKESETIVKAHYERRGKDPSRIPHHYKCAPKDFKILKNPVGLAPGLHRIKNKKSIFALPGVPREFQAMFTEEVLPFFTSPSKLVKSVIIKTKMVPEEKIFSTICPDLWDKLSFYGNVFSLPHIANVDIGVEIKANDLSELVEIETNIHRIVLESKLKPHIWQIGQLSLCEYIHKRCQEKGITISTSESCTGGLNASRLTDVPGSSTAFLGGIVSYHNDVKVNQLLVTKQSLKKFGAVSDQVAVQMAKGAVKNLHTHIAVSTTGIAGPNGGSQSKPVGIVYIGIANDRGESSSERFEFKGTREILKERFSQAALFKLLEAIDQY